MEPDVGSSVPHFASLTGDRFDELLDPFQFYSSNTMMMMMMTLVSGYYESFPGCSLHFAGVIQGAETEVLRTVSVIQ